jgi:ATP-dependent RNA circularization protein (DNA/RNA ligase family)
MKEYPKIQTVFKRDEKTHKVIAGEYSLPEFEYLKNNEWVFTEKINGTNIRILWDGTQVLSGGKTDNAQIPTFLLSKLQEIFCNEEILSRFRDIFSNTPACLYGEGYGAKIQKDGGNYIPNGVNFILFDVRIGAWWLKRIDVEDVASKLKISVVPIIGTGTLDDMIALAYVGINSKWGNFIAEGVVAKPQVDLLARSGERIITKIKHKDF